MVRRAQYWRAPALAIRSSIIRQNRARSTWSGGEDPVQYARTSLASSGSLIPVSSASTQRHGHAPVNREAMAATSADVSPLAASSNSAAESAGPQ